MTRMVLVVDDDPLVLWTAAEMLKDLGCDVITAASGNEALRVLEENDRIMALITDINMPGMDGYELLESAQSMRPGLSAILVSGREPAHPSIPYIRKPFTENELAAVMRDTTGLC